MSVDGIGNQAHHTSSKLDKKTLPKLGNQGCRLQPKVALLTADITINYPLFLTF